MSSFAALQNKSEWRTGGLVAALFILLTVAWNTWSRAPLVALGLMSGVFAIGIFLYPVAGVSIAGFLITANMSEFVGGLMSPMLLFVLLLVGLKKLISGDLRWRWTAFTWLTIVFVAWLHFTGIWASRLDEFDLSHVYRTLLLVIVITEVVDSPRDMLIVLLATLVGACFSCALTIKSFLQFFTEGAAEQVAESAVDVQKTRFAGHWMDPNYLSTSMVCYLGPSIAIWRSQVARVWKYLAFFSILLICAIVVITISRTGMIAAFLVLVMMIAVQRNRFVLGISLAALMTFLIAFAPIDALGRFLDAASDASSGERGKLLVAAWGLFIKDPIFGSGLGTLQVNLTNAYPHVHTLITAHNNYLDIATETGIIGLIAFLALLFAVGKCINWTDWSPADGDFMRGLNQGLRASFVAVLVSFGTFTAYMYSPYWLVFVLASNLPIISSAAVRKMSLGRPE